MTNDWVRNLATRFTVLRRRVALTAGPSRAALPTTILSGQLFDFVLPAAAACDTWHASRQAWLLREIFHVPDLSRILSILFYPVASKPFLNGERYSNQKIIEVKMQTEIYQRVNIVHDQCVSYFCIDWFERNRSTTSYDVVYAAHAPGADQSCHKPVNVDCFSEKLIYSLLLILGAFLRVKRSVQNLRYFHPFFEPEHRPDNRNPASFKVH